MLKAYWRLRESQDCLPPHSVIMIGLLLTFTTATFVAAQLLPLGIALWVLSLMPLVQTTQLFPQFTGIALAIGSGLLLIRLFDSETGTSFEFGAINPSRTLVVLITTGLLLLHHGKILEALRENINRYRLQKDGGGFRRSKRISFNCFSWRSRSGTALKSSARSSRKRVERTPDELRSNMSRPRGPA